MNPVALEEMDPLMVDFLRRRMSLKVYLEREAEVERKKPYQGTRARYLSGAKAVGEWIGMHGDFYVIMGTRGAPSYDHDAVVVQFPTIPGDRTTEHQRLQQVAYAFAKRFGAWEEAAMVNLVSLGPKTPKELARLHCADTRWLTVRPA